MSAHSVVFKGLTLQLELMCAASLEGKEMGRRGATFKVSPPLILY